MNLDEELRAAMLAHANFAPSGAGALDGARVRARQLDVRRRLALAAVAAAVALVAVVILPRALVGGRADGTPIGGTPTGTFPSGALTSPPSTPFATPTHRPKVPLTAAVFAPVAFPFTPAWTPSGLAEPTVGRTQDLVRLVYAGETTYLIASVSGALEPMEMTIVSTHPTTVGSRPATLTVGTDAAGSPAAQITWQLANQRWVDVRAAGQISATQVKRYADNLQNRTMPPPPLPIALTLAPQGFQVAYLEITTAEFQFCLAPPDEVDGDTETWVCVSRSQADDIRGGERVPVGSDTGELTRESGMIKLTVLRPGAQFTVRMSENGPLTEADLIRFAAAVRTP